MTASVSATIYQESWGTAALLRNQHDDLQLVMNCGQPTVQWSFRVRKLQACLTTLEETIKTVKSDNNRRDLVELLCSLQAALAKHEEQHAAVVTAAPTADDLQAYLASYAASAASPQGAL